MSLPGAVRSADANDHHHTPEKPILIASVRGWLSRRRVLVSAGHMQHPSDTPAVGSTLPPTAAWNDSLLLTAIGMGANELGTPDRQTAEAAMRVLMERWGRPLEITVSRWCSMPPALYVGVDTVLSQTWQKVFFKAGQFDGSGLDGPALSAATCAWLQRIAKNTLLNACRSYENRPIVEFADEALTAIARREAAPIMNDADEEPSPERLRMTALLECLQKRTEREIVVLRACAKFLHANQEDDSMPDEIRTELCARFRIMPANLRQIRKRALDALRTCAHGRLAQLERGE